MEKYHMICILFKEDAWGLLTVKREKVRGRKQFSKTMKSKLVAQSTFLNTLTHTFQESITKGSWTAHQSNERKPMNSSHPPIH